MGGLLLTPFLRRARSHWGLDRKAATQVYPGDDIVRDPTWSWTHGIEIDASAADVWPWIAQISSDKAGFYSYQWLENLAGCAIENADAIHPNWAITEGDELRMHPKMPPLKAVSVEPGRYFVVHGPADKQAQERGDPWVEVSWLFFLEPLSDRRCRFISRYRCATSPDRATRLQFGPTLLEPIGFAMDRRMLIGVKERAERASQR